MVKKENLKDRKFLKISIFVVVSLIFLIVVLGNMTFAIMGHSPSEVFSGDFIGQFTFQNVSISGLFSVPKIILANKNLSNNNGVLTWDGDMNLTGSGVNYIYSDGDICIGKC